MNIHFVGNRVSIYRAWEGYVDLMSILWKLYFFPYGLLAMYMQSYAESLVHRMLYAKKICFNLVGFTW